MENGKIADWKRNDPWNGMTFLFLMLLEFGLVMILVKGHLQPLYDQWLGNSLYAGTLTGATIALILLTGVYFLALRPNNETWVAVGIRSFRKKDWGIIILCVLFLLAAGAAVMAAVSFFGVSYENSKTESLTREINPSAILLALVSAAVISPVYEEIFYRGFLCRWIRTRFGVGAGILISSLIFTAAHYPVTNAMPVNFLDGIVFAWAYEKTHSIWPGVIIHGAVNAISILLLIFL
ncbi:CPBP family intramembrane glutamic endopeptidase [Metabacillus indicus]|uniref:CAAX protease n=1 Tax=Metabacillus indicus TaxID=246786 RepID=A0A084H289_METID|nr:type II CAAX endopeptidase family protein [Metabacillus indicus]KEZ53701.1 CAAX protease [Metabacillus indicus]